ncbi:MAG: SpoIVB peptidase S55 domain-containing protein [Planctomycetota bacterium]|jgi:hypothetical protein
MRNRGTAPIVNIIFLLVIVFITSPAALGLDSSKYITVDEVTTDMEAYCLSVFSGTKIERFDLKILSVVKNQRPGRDMILVEGTEERFKHSSAVHGCSGSPVFIDGRLAGALAAGWDGSLDSLYLVRPIEDMLEVGSVESAEMGDSDSKSSNSMSISYDFSKPIDLESYYDASMDQLQADSGSFSMALPLATSLSEEVCDLYAGPLKKMGLVPFAGGTALSAEDIQADKLTQGGTLAAVLCGGDISLAAIGTVTEIIDDQVYGFGHSFRGNGAINLPMASGRVHTVVASRVSSFKFASAGPIEGALLFDQAAAIRGTIGQAPKTIPLNITVNRYNDPNPRTYQCTLASDRVFTPMILQVALVGAAQMQGPLPFQHTVKYENKINLKNADPIVINNHSSGQKFNQMAMETYSAVGLMYNNPFQEVEIESIDATIDITPDNLTASMWSATLSNTRVKPGQTVTASITMKSYRAEESQISIDLKIPDNLPAGKYQAQVLGATEYQGFMVKHAPHQFKASDMDSLYKALNRILVNPRNTLHIVMPVPSTGIVLRQQELGHLPPTKMLLMQDTKRLMPVEAYQDWIENTIEMDKIVSGTALIEIIVEK